MDEPKHQQGASEKLLRLAVQAAPSGILIVDWNGDIMFANEALLEMFGYCADELLGQAVEILIPKESTEAHQQHRRSYNEQPVNRDMGKGKHFNAIKKDGHRFPVEIGLRPGEYEEGQFVIATIIDITERKLIEDKLLRHEENLEELVSERTRELREAQIEKERVIDQLIQAEKMTAIGTLASGIGHEINNPLYAILGMAEAIEAEDDTACCREYSSEIIKHTREIAAIVKNFSSYGQPSAKHDLQRVDLDERISATVLMVKHSLLNDDVEIRQNTTGTVPEILAKSEEIQQVLFNIIRNGIQAIDGKGTVEIDCNHQDDWVSIRIRDTGKGIPKQDQNKVFDPFFTTKGPNEGEGLGLYVVQQIVIRYDGKIDFESDSDMGTTFNIQFPVAH